MYNLLVSYDQNSWESKIGAMDRSRFLEYTANDLIIKHKNLENDSKDFLSNILTIFAYENMHDKPARVGKIVRFINTENRDIKFYFEFFDTVRPIDQMEMNELSWELDIGNFELNRTHWAIKDIDLEQVLKENGYLKDNYESLPYNSNSNPIHNYKIAPRVFSIPEEKKTQEYVCVLMPFNHKFNNVYMVIKDAVNKIGLECKRADDIWEQSILIDDIFNLIYHSKIVIADISENNPNVMYETGIAHTLGRDVIPLSNGEVKESPFDLAHHRILYYKPKSPDPELHACSYIFLRAFPL